MSEAPPSKRLKTSTSLSAPPGKIKDAPTSSLDAARATRQLLAAQDTETRQTAAPGVATACDNTDDDSKIASRDALAEMLLGSVGDEAEVGALALLKLAKNSKNMILMAEAGAISPLATILQNGTDEAKEYAVGILQILATSSRDNAVSIAVAGAIPQLVVLLQNGTDWDKRIVTAVLSSLSYS